MSRPPALAARRFVQTISTFTNFPRILGDLARSGGGRRPELTFRTRTGLTIVCPNVAGARVPVYEIFAEDAYRFEELTAGLGDRFTALDIGAQVGCFSVGLAAFHPGAQVAAYEASPRSAAVASANVERNDLADRVVVHPVAVSDAHGFITFQDDGSGSALNGSAGVVGDAAAASTIEMETITVPCVTFAEAVAAAEGEVTLVKIDTEGAEYSIVLGSTPSDWAGVQKIVIEYHPIEQHSWSELEAFFTTAGFHTTAHESVTDGLGTVWLTRG